MPGSPPSVENPLVSVIISNYNYGRYLGDAIKSVLGQTYSKIEVIVVDDGSTDESHEVISSFEGQITALYRDHQGQCAALNAGFPVSCGDVVVFLDSDDCLVADAIDRHVMPFKDNSEITKCQGYMNAVDAKGRPLGKKVPLQLSPSGDYKDVTLKQGPSICNHAWSSGNAWARWFIEQVFPLPEDVENSVFPDGCLNPLAALYGPIVTLEKPVADYRIHGHNKGPIGSEFSVPSLSKNLFRKRNNYEFVAKRAESLGLKPPLEDWFKGRSYWKDNLMVYAISLMDASQKKPRFHEVVLAPFVTGGVGILKASSLALMLTIIWLSPRKQSLEMIRRLLRIPESQKIHTIGTNAN
ncbi:MAG: glycosyltransferase family 2 protein [Arenicellales bacterium]